MPSKKRKYNARFPAGRIKKIMQTDEEVGKVAQAVPIIISRTLELFVESLLSKAMQVTVSRNAKTLSPSHVKQCILAESRFDFLRDLVKNIPDVSAAEEKEMMSAEDSPNSSRFSDTAPPRRIVREDSNSSSSSDVRLSQIIQPPPTSRTISSDLDTPKVQRTETVTSTIISTDTVIDLSKKATEESKPIRTANFYQETLLTDEVQHKSVIKVNPTYSSPQPSTSTYTTLTSIEPIQRVEIPVPKPDHKIYLDLRQQNNNTSAIPSPKTLTPTPRTLTPTPRTPITPTTLTPRTPITQTPRTPITPTPRTPITPSPRTPITPILNIDFTKSLAKPEIKVLDAAAGNIPFSVAGPKNETILNKELMRQNSKSQKAEFKAVELKPNVYQPPLFNIDHLNSGNLQIDEDYDT